jgi:hypothetical protein
MKKILLIGLVLLSGICSIAQSVNGSVKGTLKDSATSHELNDATVSVIAAKDSSIISFTLSSNSGFFEIKNVSEGDYILLVSYEGFSTLRKPFAISKTTPNLDLGTVR